MRDAHQCGLRLKQGIYYFVSGSGGQLRKGDQDRTFMLVEISGNVMSFQTITRTGQSVDSGTIQRQIKP